MTDSFKLRDKVAIITGASSGIGTAVARNLSAAGVRILVTARRADRLEALCLELENCSMLAGDVQDESLPEKLLDRALELHQRCDVVVNNAGIIETGSIDELDLERVTRMVRINVEAAFRVAHVAARHFHSSGGGHLVNISSILGVKSRPHAGAYAGTKHALEALSEGLRLEFAGTGVKVSCVEPGLVLSELHEHYDVHPVESMQIRNPLMPEDVARCVRFVLEQPAHVRIPRLMVLPAENRV